MRCETDHDDFISTVITMSELKKALFGGYKKSAVDSKMQELTRQLDSADADNKRFAHELDATTARIAELEQQLAAAAAENAALKAEKSKNDAIFNNVAKIYQRAYDAGHDIVCDSKDITYQMLKKLDMQFDAAMGDTAAMTAHYDATHRDMEALLAELTQKLDDVNRSAAQIMNKAKTFSGIYGDMKQVVADTQGGARQILTDYEQQASEFLTSNDQAEPETPAAVEPEAPVATEPEIPAATEPEIPAAAEPETPTAAEPKAPTAAEPETPAAAEPEAPAADSDLHVLPHPAGNPPVKAAATEHTPAAPKSSSEFTQFGRKSKISAQDRNELLRKALLRNGGQ